MAIYRSKLITNAANHRGIYEGQEYDVVGRIALKTGTVLTTADDFYAIPLGENQVVTKVKAYAVGATGLLQVSLGYFQIIDPTTGLPLVVERNGPSGYAPATTRFTSPATSDAAYAAGAVLTTARQVIVTPTTKLAGPVYFGAAVTTGATLAADVEIFLGVTIDGETSTEQVVDPFPTSNDYLLG
jgi:hypothetical protein